MKTIEKVTLSIGQWEEMQLKMQNMEETIAYYEGVETDDYSLKDDLVCKLAEIRNDFNDSEIEEYAMICSPLFVLQAMVDKIKRSEDALGFYANDDNYDRGQLTESHADMDCGHIAREALGILND